MERDAGAVVSTVVVLTHRDSIYRERARIRASLQLRREAVARIRKENAGSPWEAYWTGYMDALGKAAEELDGPEPRVVSA